jgi:hypothetical protein
MESVTGCFSTEKNKHDYTFGKAGADFWNGRLRVLDSLEPMPSKTRRATIQNPHGMTQKNG